MPALARLQASDCANPVLDVWTQVNGILIDVAVLEFQIFDVSDSVKQITPVQVFPVIAGTRASVDVVNLCPGPFLSVADGFKISTGRFVAKWTPPISEPLGTHRIVWFFKLQLASPEQTFTEEFEVLVDVAGFGSIGYCTVSDLRAEGVSSVLYSDLLLLDRIAVASKQIDKWTRRFFEPRPQTLQLDGRGGRAMMLNNPIIGISAIFLTTSVYTPGDLAVDLSTVRIYNRHLTQGLLSPDDRENPKVEFIHDNDVGGVSDSLFVGIRLTSLRWPRGQQNVKLVGVFGYTDPDGSPTGTVPTLIRYVTKRMVIRTLPPLASSAAAALANASRTIEEKTRDQTVRYATLAQMSGSKGTSRSQAFTGDPEIDGIIAEFVGPPQMAGV